MQFYKERNFAFLISDTFNFFKEYGRNYFKNYFAICGALLLINTLIFIFGYREFFMQLMMSNTGGEAFVFGDYFNNNWVLLTTITIISFILFLVLAMIVYTFPVFYMKRVAEGQTMIKADDILSDMKNNVGKISIFLLGLLFILLPLFFILMMISSFLMIIIIGFFLLILLFPAFANIISMTLYDHLNTKKGFFGALSYSMRMQLGEMFDIKKTKFWKYWASTIVMYIALYVISLIFTMVPYFIMMFGIFTQPTSTTMLDPTQLMTGTMGIIFFVIYGISILVSSVLYNLLSVNAGLMYYDSRADLHRNIDISEIDTIGNNEV